MTRMSWTGNTNGGGDIIGYSGIGIDNGYIAVIVVLVTVIVTVTVTVTVIVAACLCYTATAC